MESSHKESETVSRIF